MTNQSNLALTVGCLYVGTAVTLSAVAEAMGCSVGSVCSMLRTETGVRVSRDWRVKGPAGIRLTPSWAV